MSADSLHGDGQLVPPPPSLPSSLPDPAPIERLPPLPSDATADIAGSEGPPSPEPDARREVCIDAVSSPAPDNVRDRAADNGGVQGFVDPDPDDPDAEPFPFDPDTLVAFGDRDAKVDRVSWEQSRHLAAALRPTSEAEASGRPPFLGWFADAAIPAAKGRYRFGLDREQLFAAMTHLAAIAGRPKKSTPTVRIALRGDLCKLSVASTRYEFAAIALDLKDAASGFEPGAAPVAFAMPIPKLTGIARTGEPGVPVRFELNGARSRLLVLGRRLRRGPVGLPNQQTQPLLGTPKPVGMLDPLPLAQGLRLLDRVVSKRQGPRDFGSRSRVYVRDGMVFGYRDMVLGVLHAPGLAGLEAMVHAANLGSVGAMLSRLDGSRTGHFVTEFHSLLTDESTWVGLLTKPDIAFHDSDLLAYLLQREPTDTVVVPCSDLLADLDSLLEFIKGEPGAGLVRMRVKDVGIFARMALQVADRPNRHRGLVLPLKCYRECKLNPRIRAKDIDMRVNLKALLGLVDYFFKTFSIVNVVLDVLPSSAALPRPVLRLRHEVEGKGGYTIQAFLIGTP